MFIERCFSLLLLLCLLTTASGVVATAQPITLWTIGQPAKSTGQFALGPNGYTRYSATFTDDPFYVVGISDPSKDWPYVHPGPADSWAGSKAHTFYICFGLQDAPTAGSYELRINLVDTHRGGPPRVVIGVNDRVVATVNTPSGAGDESIFGHPEKGAHSQIKVAVPAKSLRAGANTVAITTQSGAWMLYDSVELSGPAGVTLTQPSGVHLGLVRVDPALYGSEQSPKQAITMAVQSFGRARHAIIKLGKVEIAQVNLQPGANQVTAEIPPVKQAVNRTISVVVDGKVVDKTAVKLTPVKRWTIYITPHSHNDIGYTDLQPNILKKQMSNIAKGIELAKATQANPQGSQYRWNIEVLWASDSYMRQSPEKEKEFLDAVKAGWLGLDGLYLNELTGLCRPEELVRLTRFATMLSQRTGVKVDSAMISDVPGLSWGTVQALSQAGIRYISDGVNPGDRIGSSLVTWEDKPFYWISASGREKVLFWTPHTGYALSHLWGPLSNPATPDHIFSMLHDVEAKHYPYDIFYMRWSGFGDNAVPDEYLPEFVKNWNAKYLSPKFVIATTSQAFHAFEKRYGKQLPSFKGDFTPYWEDGAGSSAHETALNRQSADRLTQTETLWAMRSPQDYPAADHYEAWRNVLLYSEHTWGAYNSISEPDLPFVKDQWKIKQGFALDADTQSRELQNRALSVGGAVAQNQVDVYNTNNWPRTDLVTVPKELAATGDLVVGQDGKPVPSQRLSTGELAFFATDVAPFSSRRYAIKPGTPSLAAGVIADGLTLSNKLLSVTVDPDTGAVSELHANGAAANLVDTKNGEGLNQYFYLPGGDLKGLKTNGRPRITILENGPLVASLLIQSDAPGCNSLTREVRVVAGLNRVDMTSLLDKRAVREVEGGHIGFPFLVPDGQARLDVQYSVVRPNVDQIPAACKNWFSVSRWADVSNNDQGVTWVTQDCPLVQVGGITANLPRSQSDPFKPWLHQVDPAQSLYAWIFNNHWHTNYCADQQGPLLYRFSVTPHGAYDALSAARFGVERCQPLVVSAAVGEPVRMRLSVEPDNVVVTALKPSDDGKAYIVRLFGASGKDARVRLNFGEPKPRALSLSDTSEAAVKPIGDSVLVPAWSLVTVRAER